MVSNQENFLPPRVNDILLEVDKKSYFTVIVNKRLDNNKYSSPEEVIIDFLFKYNKIKYQKIEHHSSEINFYFGKIPVIYTLNSIIDNVNIPKFLYEMFFQEENPFIFKFDNLIYLLKETYKLSFDFLLYVKNIDKLNTKNTIIEKIKIFFKRDYIYENSIKVIFDNYSRFNDNNEYNLSLEEKAKAIISYAYNFIMEIYYSETKKKETTINYRKRELFLNIFIYGFIKEEIDNPNITNIFQSNIKINKFKNDIINFIENEVTSKIGNINNSVIVLKNKLTDNLLKKIKDKNCIKNFNAEKQVDVIDNQLSLNFKSHLLSLFLFFGSGCIFYLLTRKYNETLPKEKSISRLIPLE